MFAKMTRGRKMNRNRRPFKGNLLFTKKRKNNNNRQARIPLYACAFTVQEVYVKVEVISGLKPDRMGNLLISG